MDADMAAYYEQGAERDRLATIGALERARTEILLERHLPAPPAVVLDVGGGPGAYASRLTADGYDVELLDPVPLHVEQALAAGVRARPGDARALPWEDGHAAAVLLLGPLYHLHERADRVTALREAARVTRPGGLVAAAAISRFAPLLDGLYLDRLADAGFEERIAADLRDGRHANPDRRPGWFTTAYFHRPEDLAAEVAEAGLRLEAVLAVEGVGAFLPDVAERLADPARREVLLRSIARVEAEPALLGASPHLLAIARA